MVVGLLGYRVPNKLSAYNISQCVQHHPYFTCILNTTRIKKFLDLVRISFRTVSMLSITRVIQRFCSQAASATSLEAAPFVGRVGTGSNPRSLAPVITSNVINGQKNISFTCISRFAAAKAFHAAAIANVKNQDKDRCALVKFSLIEDVLPKEGMIAKGLSSFEVAMLSEERPITDTPSSKVDRNVSRRTRIASTTDYMELAKNLHQSYMRRTNVILECMGDKSLGVIAHSLASFNEKVATHELLAYPMITHGKAMDGTEIAKIEIHIVERSKE